MNPDERLHLQKLCIENNVEDYTEDIRKFKHSAIIRADVNKIAFLKHAANTTYEELREKCVEECQFLFTYYTDIFNRILKDEIDLSIFATFLDTLKEVEDGAIDQHDASYRVGTILKQIYVDSALRKAEKLSGALPTAPNDGANISWKQWKALEKFKRSGAAKK